MKKPFSLNLEDVPLIEVGDDKYVSGRRYIAEKSFTDSGWHQHNMGVLGSLESGIMGLRTEKESMVVSSGMIVYLPANTKHNEHGMGTEVTGWYICLPQERIEFMPKTICVLEQSDLLLALCNRVISWGEIKEKTQTQKRLVTTFLDELQTVEEAKYLSLPFPEHSGLHIVTKRLINEPEDMNSIDYWAKAAGLSRRSFTRHFYEQTGLSFVLWRQRAKLYVALLRLAEGHEVTRVAMDLGYQNPSTFIAVFRKQFGSTPAQYIRTKRNGHK